MDPVIWLDPKNCNVTGGSGHKTSLPLEPETIKPEELDTARTKAVEVS